jgi:hypothetical protein
MVHAWSHRRQGNASCLIPEPKARATRQPGVLGLQIYRSSWFVLRTSQISFRCFINRTGPGTLTKSLLSIPIIIYIDQTGAGLGWQQCDSGIIDIFKRTCWDIHDTYSILLHLNVHS